MHKPANTRKDGAFALSFYVLLRCFFSSFLDASRRPYVQSSEAGYPTLTRPPVSAILAEALTPAHLRCFTLFFTARPSRSKYSSEAGFT